MQANCPMNLTYSDYSTVQISQLHCATGSALRNKDVKQISIYLISITSDLLRLSLLFLESLCESSSVLCPPLFIMTPLLRTLGPGTLSRTSIIRIYIKSRSPAVSDMQICCLELLECSWFHGSQLNIDHTSVGVVICLYYTLTRPDSMFLFLMLERKIY